MHRSQARHQYALLGEATFSGRGNQLSCPTCNGDALGSITNWRLAPLSWLFEVSNWVWARPPGKKKASGLSSTTGLIFILRFIAGEPGPNVGSTSSGDHGLDRLLSRRSQRQLGPGALLTVCCVSLQPLRPEKSQSVFIFGVASEKSGNFGAGWATFSHCWPTPREGGG